MNTRRGKPVERDPGLLAHVRRAEARKAPLAQISRVFANRSTTPLRQSASQFRFPLSPTACGNRNGNRTWGDLKKGAITYVKARRPLIPLIEPAAGA